MAIAQMTCKRLIGSWIQYSDLELKSNQNIPILPEAFLTFASKSSIGPSCVAHGPYTPCTIVHSVLWSDHIARNTQDIEQHVKDISQHTKVIAQNTQDIAQHWITDAEHFDTNIK